MGYFLFMNRQNYRQNFIALALSIFGVAATLGDKNKTLSREGLFDISGRE